MDNKQARSLLKKKREANKKIAEATTAFWQAQGIDVEPDHNVPDKIYQLQLVFTEHVWVNLLNKEGEFLPPCCSQISFIRDKLMDALREDGWLKAGDLEELALTIKAHECDTLDPLHPLQQIVTLYDLVKDHLVKGTVYGRDTVDLEDPQSCLSALARYAGLHEFHNYFTANAPPERKHHSACCKEHLLLDLEPVIHTLHNKLRELSEPQSGYGLFDEKGEVAYSTQGVAVYKTRAIAEEICQAWNENEQGLEKKESKQYHVHYCTLSLKHGLQCTTEPSDAS